MKTQERAMPIVIAIEITDLEYFLGAGTAAYPNFGALFGYARSRIRS
jgi:hypothetical protein